MKKTVKQREMECVMAMDCRECTSLIRDFLDDRLDNGQLSDFLEHMEECSDCREELSDHYLVYKGLEKLETGGAFDLTGGLREEMEAAEERLRKRRRLFRLAAGLEILTVSIFVIVITMVALY